MREMAGGVSAAYQNPGTPCPDNVRQCLDGIRQRVAKARGPLNRARVIARSLRELGQEMGAAAKAHGYDEGQRPTNDELRVDMPLRDFLMVRWLAHAGFKLMMRNGTGAKFCFRDQTDAQQSNFALDRLERHLAQAQHASSAPYALALGRQQMIALRWPQVNAAESEPETLRNAA